MMMEPLIFKQKDMVAKMNKMPKLELKGKILQFYQNLPP